MAICLAYFYASALYENDGSSLSDSALSRRFSEVLISYSSTYTKSNNSPPTMVLLLSVDSPPEPPVAFYYEMRET